MQIVYSQHVPVHLCTSPNNHGANSSVSEQLHEQGVLLAAVNDVRCSHPLCQTSDAALHPACISHLSQHPFTDCFSIPPLHAAVT